MEAIKLNQTLKDAQGSNRLGGGGVGGGIPGEGIAWSVA